MEHATADSCSKISKTSKINSLKSHSSLSFIAVGFLAEL